MKGASKVIMGATLVMVVTLAIVLALILVLLVELYCSLLLRRRRQLKEPTSTSNSTTSAAAAAASTTNNSTSSDSHPAQDHNQSTSPLSSFYAQGVLHAPRDFLFPAEQKKKKHENFDRLLHQVLELHSQEPSTSPHQIGILSPNSPTASLHEPVEEISIPVGTESSNTIETANFVYISNPIYDNDAEGRPDTPFETPDTSPSRLENSGSSADDDDVDNKAEQERFCSEPDRPVGVMIYSPPLTPPLSPMKKLPAQACSVSLRDPSSLGTSGSDSNSNNGISSSSSGSPCTSPSWRGNGSITYKPRPGSSF